MADRGYSALNIAKRAMEQPSILEALKSAYSDMSASDPGIAPMGIVVNSSNALKIAQNLNNAYKKIKSPELIEAINFISQRYPKLFGLANRGIHERVMSGLKGKQFDVVDDGILKGSSIVLNPKSNQTSLEAVETLMHELVHSYQSRRLGLEKVKALELFPSLNPLEKYAEQGGRTAGESFKNFLKIIK